MMLLFHLSLGAGDFACASHAKQMADGEQHHAGMQMGGHYSAANESPLACNSSQKECPAPITSECCTAMVSCGAVFVTCAGADAFVATQRTSSPFTDLLTASSGPTRPETPPPRA